MTFNNNENMFPNGETLGQQETNRLEKQIEALRETVSTLADRLNALSSEVTTSQLNAEKADISDAKISNADVDKVTADEAEVTALSGDTVHEKAVYSDFIAADEATITDAVIQSVTANSVNSESYTGESVNVESVKAGEAELGDITAESVKTGTLEVSGNAEIKGSLTQRGNINFPENGDIIQGEYVEFWGRNAKLKNLITHTPQDSTQLVGYDNNGNLIPVDGTLDPGNFWRNKEGEPGTIETKDGKGIDVADIACDDLTAEGVITVTGDITATGDVSCDNASVTTDATVGGDVTVSGDASVTGDISGNNITASGKVQGDNADFANDVLIHGDLYVDGVEHVVQEENIVSQNDFITLRANNSASLGSKKSGLLINNYNGSDSLAVVTDGDGTLRVGTGVGTETTYNDIYFDSAADKWYTDIEDPTSEVTPSGSLVEWASVSESGTVTHYGNAVFKAIDFSQGTLEPLLTREEDADLNDQGLLKYNHASEKADTLPLPTDGKFLKGNVTGGAVSYSWEEPTVTTEDAAVIGNTKPITSNAVALELQTTNGNVSANASDISSLNTTVGNLAVDDKGFKDDWLDVSSYLTLTKVAESGSNLAIESAYYSKSRRELIVNVSIAMASGNISKDLLEISSSAPFELYVNANIAQGLCRFTALNSSNGLACGYYDSNTTTKMWFYIRNIGGSTLPSGTPCLTCVFPTAR